MRRPANQPRPRRRLGGLCSQSQPPAKRVLNPLFIRCEQLTIDIILGVVPHGVERSLAYLHPEVSVVTRRKSHQHFRPFGDLNRFEKFNLPISNHPPDRTQHLARSSIVTIALRLGRPATTYDLQETE